MLSAVLLAALAQVTPAPSPGATGIPSPVPSPGLISVQPAALKVHPSSVQTLFVRNAAGTVRATIDTPIAALAVDAATNTVTVTAGAAPGTATITIADQNGATVQVPLRIALYAGALPAVVRLRVTGFPVPSDWLQSQITKSVVSAAQSQAGAAIQLGGFAPPLLATPGSSAAVGVPVHISGGETYFDVDATANVSVEQVATTPFSPPYLLYDDDPEKLAANGLVFESRVAAGAPARLYYYHQNSDAQRRLLVVLTPASSSPSTVQLIDSSAGPNIDVMSVGHAVSRNFLLQKAQNQGIVVDVGSNPYVADNFLLNPLDGAAGSIGINILSGDAVNVAVVSAPPDATPASVQAYLSQPKLAGDGHRRTGVFRLEPGYTQNTLTYTVGQSGDAMVNYGTTTPAPASADAGHDYGDYGVIRSMTFSATNPTNQTATLYLYEAPQGGAVRSTFIVNGTPFQLGCARLPNHYQIGPPIVLPPSQTTQIQIQTMTDGGSSYPIEVGITATPPQPTTPPMYAPDGCFPK